MTNILLTGGAGYIGSVTANLLIDKGFKVTIIDNLSTGNIKNLPQKAFFLKVDISDEKKISNLLKINKFDILVHLAAFIDVEESTRKAKKYFDNNYYKTLKFINICKKNELNKLVFSSTASVYGNSDKGIVYENSPLKPISPYAKSKLKCENFIIKQKNFNYIILRYFNVAGADHRLRSGLISKKKSTHLIKKLCENYLKRKSIDIYGNDYPSKDGTAIRDYINVMDLAEIHYQAIKFLKKYNKSKIFNCGYGNGHSVMDVIKQFNLINKRKIKYVYKPRRRGDLFKLVANTNKIRKIFKINFKFNSLKKILKSSLDWEKSL